MTTSDDPIALAHAQKAPIRVALVEDHHLVREGLLLVLSAEPGIEIVGEAANWQSTVEMVDGARPDILLLDITLPDADALSRLHELVTTFPDVRVVILTMHADPETVRQALAAGASGYMVKGSHSRDLIAAIREVAQGERYLHSSVSDAVVDEPRGAEKPERITAREREVLILFASGRRAPDIARQLGISVHTVRRHLANLSTKLGVSGVNGLTRYAMLHGLIIDRSAPADTRVQSGGTDAVDP
jgi:DNA-binding NarL/FixJ family response regulator